LETVDGRLGEERVGHDGEPFDRLSVGGDHGGRSPVALHHELVDVLRLGGVHGLEAEVVDQEEVDADELAHLGFVAHVEPGSLEPLEHPVGSFEVDGLGPAAGDMTEGVGHERLADPDRNGDRLQHLRSVLPTEVRVTAETHPLFGQLLQARGFKRLGGLLHLVVMLRDGSPGTIRAEATNVFGESAPVVGTTVLSVEGIRHLRAVVASHTGRGASRRPRQARK
jgi:hypothetical protein